MNEIKFFQETYEAFKEAISQPGLNKTKTDRIIRNAGKRFGITDNMIKKLQTEFYKKKSLDDFFRLFVEKIQEENAELLIEDKRLNIIPKERIYEIPNTGVVPINRIYKIPNTGTVPNESKIHNKEYGTETVLPTSNQQKKLASKHEQKREATEEKRLKLGALKSIDIEKLNSTEEIDNFIKELCMQGIMLNEVEFKENDKTITDAKYIEINEKIEHRLREIASRVKATNKFNFQIIYGEDVIRVFRWILGKKPEIYKNILARQNKVRLAYSNGPERILRIIEEPFQNNNGGLDLCTMVFIIERLKRENFNAITRNHLDLYNNRYKNKVEGFFNKLIGIAYAKNDEQQER